MFPGIQNRALIHSLWYWSIEIKLWLNKWCTDKLYQKCPCSAHAEHCAGLMGGGGHTDWWKCNWSHVQCSSKQCWWQDYPGRDQQWLCNAMWPYQISSVLSTIHTALHIANYNQPVPARVLASQSTMGICLLKVYFSNCLLLLHHDFEKSVEFISEQILLSSFRFDYLFEQPCYPCSNVNDIEFKWIKYKVILITVQWMNE